MVERVNSKITFEAEPEEPGGIEHFCGAQETVRIIRGKASSDDFLIPAGLPILKIQKLSLGLDKSGEFL